MPLKSIYSGKIHKSNQIKRYLVDKIRKEHQIIGMKANAIVGQSGGPTAVINSSLAGIIQAAVKSPLIDAVYGMNYGIEGFMNERLIDLGSQDPTVIEGLRVTPSSSLGSSRHKLTDNDFPLILDILKKYNIRYFFLIGGNDTMDTVHRIEMMCRTEGWELRGIGVPKTVDNDLFGTDHTPGFPSAARYNLLSVMQSGILARDMQQVDKYVVYQTVGRDAGWLAAATALARKTPEDAPHLIYLPERPFIKEKFIADAKTCVEKNGWVSIVVSEGIKYPDGTPVSSTGTTDKFNNIEYGAMGGGSAALSVHRILHEATGWRGEFQITESLNMSAIDRASAVDLDEAYECGRKAVEYAESGLSGVMVAIRRLSDAPYKAEFTSVPLCDVAVRAREMPAVFINEEGNGVTEDFLEYARPLVGRLPDYVKLEKIAVEV